MQRVELIFPTTLACLVFASTANADLLPGLPTGSGGGGVVGTVTGTVTGTVGGVTGSVGGAVDGLLNSPPSSGGGSSLPADTVDDLISSLLGGDTGTTPSTPGDTGGGGSSGPTTGGSTSGSGATASGGASAIQPSSDKTAPRLTFKIVNKLKQAARTGKLKVRITSSEAGVVALNAELRPGRARHVGKRRLKVSHKLVRTRTMMLAYRRAGSLTARITLPKKSRRSLAHARNARVWLRAWAADLSRNQARKDVKRTVKR